MDEKEILRKIKEDADQVLPPASLEPEAVERMLKEQMSQTQMDKTQTDKAGYDRKLLLLSAKKKRRRRIAQLGSLAAVFALALLAFSQSDRILKHQEQAEATALQSEPETERVKAMNEAAAAAETADETHAADDIVARSGAATEAADEADAATDTIARSGAATEATDEADAAAAPPPAEVFTYVTDYEALYNSLKEQLGQNSLYRSSYGVMYSAASGKDAGATTEAAQEDGVAMDMEADMAPNIAAADTAGTTGTDSPDFSGTNLQEAGVDEADIVKTDGNYLYILRQDGSFAIVTAGLTDPAVSSVTTLEHASDITIHEMYLDGDVLSIITSGYATSLESNEDVYYTSYRRETTLRTYDISDRAHPVLTGTVTQDGSYEDSRKNGPYIYLFTCYQPTIAETYAESAVVPKINGSLASAGDIYLPESIRDSSYLVISSVDTAAPDAALDTKILVSGASNYYVSAENIYIANEHYDRYVSTTTELIKFHYENGIITGVAAGTVKGYLNNSFSMNEYQGMLRVVATYQGDELSGLRELVSDVTDVYYEDNWTDHNALYVLDETLQVVGSIDGLAEGETIRSARFFGDTGYFVTFRQTDPLFSVDLSDPASPKVLGELKISGFSSYLHFYGDGLLLGIGYEADEETGVTSGLKLSMFDISDPADVREVNRLIIPGVSWCPAIEDYKAILVSPEKNLIGFFCDDRYMLFSYDAENGFTRSLLYDFFADSLADKAEYNNLRGLYIGDGFYLAGDAFVITFDMDNAFEKTAMLPLYAEKGTEAEQAETGTEAGTETESESGTGTETETGTTETDQTMTPAE